MGAWARTAPLAIAWEGTDSDLRARGALQAVLKGGQGLLGIGFTGKRSAAELLKGWASWSLRLSQRLSTVRCAWGGAMLGVDEEPALLHTAIARGQS